MKSFLVNLTIFSTLFVATNCLAQQNDGRRDRYMKLSAGFGVFIPVNPGPKDLSVSFPYSVSDNNGSATNHQFNGGLKKAFSTVPNYADVSFDLGYHNHFYALKCDVSLSELSGVSHGILSAALGYGHIWAFANGHFEKATNADQKLLNLSASLSFAVMNRKEQLGAINDEGLTVNAFGKEIPPDFQLYESSNEYSTSNLITYHSKQILAMYSQTGYGFMPQFAINTSPYRTKLQLEFDVSCFLPLVNTSGISLYQTDGSNSDYATSSHGFAKDDVTITSGNSTYTHSPFSMCSVHVGIKVGLQASRWQRSRS